MLHESQPAHSAVGPLFHGSEMSFARPEHTLFLLYAGKRCGEGRRSEAALTVGPEPARQLSHLYQCNCSGRPGPKRNAIGNPSWGDFDGDGYFDLWVDNHYNSRPYFYKNNGNGTFTDVFASTGLDAKGDKHGNGLCDYNNDGNLDLHITIGAGGGTLLGEKSDRTNKNLGGFFFLDVTEEAGTDNTWGRGRSVAWGDYDRDGYADLSSVTSKQTWLSIATTATEPLRTSPSPQA